MDRHHHAGEIAADVLLWRRGRAEASALLLAATVSSWILLGSSGSSGYTAVSLSSNVLLLLLTVLFAWSKAALLLGRPLPPVPDLQPAMDALVSLFHAGLTRLAAAFRRVALGHAEPGLFVWLAAASLLGGLAGDLPTFCHAAAVGALTVPVLYERCSVAVTRYARLASVNVYRYELLYQSFSLRCYLSARDWLIEVLKEP